MKGIITRSLGLSLVLAATTVTLTAGESPKAKDAGTPLISDWSQRHVVFSHPRTPSQAARLQRVQRDFRYQQQQERAKARPDLPLRGADSSPAAVRFWRNRARHKTARRLHRDWSWDLGPGATVGRNNAPAKYSFLSNVANCGLSTSPDFVVYNTSLLGGATQGSIVALTNLYAGCGGQVPASFWSYDTGGTVLTSPVISLDGTQIAFTQTTGGTASLVLLKWLKFDGQVNNPATDLVTAGSASAYPTCPAPCMVTLPLGANDTNSSVYYDYGSDIAYVGDDSGKLHQFTGVFKGTPAEVTTGWPVSLSGNKLTSTVHDPGSGNTFVGDSGGFLYRVDGSGGATKSAQLDFGGGLSEPPMLDDTIGVAYVFSSNDGATTPHAGVFQISTTFATGATGPEVTVGTANTGTTPVYDGAFDHNYIFSSNSTGNLYACGNPGGKPTLYQIPISAGVMGTPLAGPVLSTATPNACSPLTDVYNPFVTGAGLPQEWIFVGVTGAGSPSACVGHSCAMGFKVTQWQPNFNYNTGQEILDSNFNIEVVDNSGGGISGATPPVWGATPFAPTTDGTVKWRNQGPLLALVPNAAWVPNTPYAGAAEVIDSNNNIEIAEPTGGTSGLSTPLWPLTEGGTVNDNGIIWYNLGKNPVAGLQEPGGTSAFIIDNLVNANGTSQVYFTTLQNDGCFTSGGTGGCAIQASQDGLN